MRRGSLSLLMAAITAGCAEAPSPRAVEELTFSTTGCYGTCPVFSFSVSETGRGEYHGEAFVAVRGTKDFTVTPEQFQAFVRRLTPFRPRGEITYDTNCDGPWATDNPSVRISWSDNKTTDTLNWYLGCQQPGLIEHVEVIYDAWQELPLDDLVGTDENRFNYDSQDN